MRFNASAPRSFGVEGLGLVVVVVSGVFVSGAAMFGAAVFGTVVFEPVESGLVTSPAEGVAATVVDVTVVDVTVSVVTVVAGIGNVVVGIGLLATVVDATSRALGALVEVISFAGVEGVAVLVTAGARIAVEDVLRRLACLGLSPLAESAAIV